MEKWPTTACWLGLDHESIIIQPAWVLVSILFPHRLLPGQRVGRDLDKHFIVTSLDQFEVTVQWNSGVAHHITVSEKHKNLRTQWGCICVISCQNNYPSWVERQDPVLYFCCKVDAFFCLVPGKPFSISVKARKPTHNKNLEATASKWVLLSMWL